MSVVKRKRGRPRLDESHEYNEFDLNLIQEFKKNPVLYDRTHPEHRNREYTDRIWNRIANNINTSTTHIKNRILQLRNRYNVEKRRTEALQEQQPDTCITSQWSLYKYLTFLNDYTKSRRPYSMPSSYQSKSGAALSDADEEPNEDSQTVVNGNLESGDDLTNSQNFGHSGSQMPNINNGNVQLYDILSKNAVCNEGGGEANGHKKFKDFGQFLAASLMEMNEIQALALINKFTNELVKSLKIAQKFKNASNASNSDYMKVNSGGGVGPPHDSDSVDSDS